MIGMEWENQQQNMHTLFIRRKNSLFPLTSPKKLGTVGRHNFFFLLTLFSFFKESYSFLYCKHVHFCYFYFKVTRARFRQ